MFRRYNNGLWQRDCFWVKRHNVASFLPFCGENMRFYVMFLALTVLGSCAIVPQNRRQHFADPTMQATPCPLEARAKRKFYGAREGASGGDGLSAGGGCGCAN